MFTADSAERWIKSDAGFRKGVLIASNPLKYGYNNMGAIHSPLLWGLAPSFSGPTTTLGVVAPGQVTPAKTCHWFAATQQMGCPPLYVSFEASAQGCAYVCGGGAVTFDGSPGWSGQGMGGPSIGGSFNAGVLFNSQDGWSSGWTCEFATPLGGIYVSGGTNQNGSPYGGGGAAWGVKGGCAAGGGYSAHF